MPESSVFVPAVSEEAARLVLKRHCYNQAPVNEWPCLGVVRGSRRKLFVRGLSCPS